MRTPTLQGFMVLALGAACASPDSAVGPTHLPSVADTCAGLLVSPPTEWAERLPAVFSAGAAAVPLLVAGLRERPDAPGAQAAIALLGRLDGATAQPFLDELVRERSHHAVEAALALGQLRATGSLPALRACADDRYADATLRTAAACALVRCGDRASAMPVLRAVLLAGTPAGAEWERQTGLPSKTRWALERYFVQRLLVQEGAGELANALDTDAPWHVLEAVTSRIVAWLAGS